MIARLARIALLVEALSYLLLASFLKGRGLSVPAIAVVIVCAVAGLRALVALGPFLAVMGLRWRDGLPLRGQRFARAMVGEFIAKSWSFSWWQPFEAWHMPADPAPAPGAGQPVLLVHGYLCNRGSWKKMRAGLGRLLPNQVYTLSLEPPFAPIDSYVEQVEKRVQAILGGSGASRVHLVCHSMGGLVARAWISRQAAWPRVASLTMLGSPHQGTLLAGAGIGHNVRQMARGSAWLAELAAREQGCVPPVQAISLHTENDNLVYPPASADLPWCTNVRVDGLGHVQLQSSARMIRFVADAVARAESGASQGGAKED